ncbi:hypothetical protein N8I74_09820 [Chitiniphilus purpureus]|uniref:Kazal-like domain-containing protein n=1 Tax=Chitiniphilus purpureus TaxID=2981137 RepID=A0ABY6DH07_9NEIS|nr:hypothetical protein [Chitiniphilus sp. CD1]UXY13624.1 hypothetical protein N8I74_09820 [Chitiniphilus sp. CD1]
MKKKLITLVFGFGFALGMGSAVANAGSCTPTTCLNTYHMCLSVNNGHYGLCAPAYQSCLERCQGS